MSNLCTSDDTLTSKDLISFARQISCGMVSLTRSFKLTFCGIASFDRGLSKLDHQNYDVYFMDKSWPGIFVQFG